MKKFTLVAALAAVALGANAQYTCDPSLKTVLDGGKVADVQYIALDEASLQSFENQGATVTNFGPNGDNQNLWVWSDTFTAGDGSYPGVDDQLDGYVSLVVASVGWSGAGYNVTDPGVDTSKWNDNTHFHLAYYSPATACTSVALIIGDQDGVNTPARVALGTAFSDNGVNYPAIAPASNDDWQGIDLTFAQLKKLCPSFSYSNTTAWAGNIMSFLCGAVTGQTIAFDAVYFYNYEVDGITDITADNNAAVEYFNLQGVRVNGDMTPGLYIRRQGNEVSKVVVK